MRTTVRVVAERRDDGLTVLREVHAEGPALAVRRTGTDRGPLAQVHLVGTAAGPMGGDDVDVRVELGPGAALELLGVAASVVLPARDEPRSRLRLHLDVAAGAVLTCALPVVVVTGRAEHEATTTARLAGDARLVLSETVRLGRHDEPGGWWRGRLDVTRDHVPLLRQTTTLGEDPDDGLRALRSVLDTAGSAPAGADDDTVVMPLAAGGTLTTTLG